jgi:hypothetical protein
LALISVFLLVVTVRRYQSLSCRYIGPIFVEPRIRTTAMTKQVLSRMTEYADKRVWNVDNHEVTTLHLDYRFAFDCFWTDNNFLSIIIEAPFTLHYPERTISCDPQDVSSLKEAILILHQSISMLTAYRDGRLLVTFADNTHLQVIKDLQYDSWQAQGQGELEDIALLCTPHLGPPWKE